MLDKDEQKTECINKVSFFLLHLCAGDVEKWKNSILSGFECKSTNLNIEESSI